MGIREKCGSWSQEGSKLVGTGSVGSTYQGYSVALWNTLASGGYKDDSDEGAVWVFMESIIDPSPTMQTECCHFWCGKYNHV